MDVPIGSAPAQAETPDLPVAAADAAMANNDFSAFRDARAAERDGKPLPEVDAPEPSLGSTPTAPETRKSRAEKEQARINDTITRGVDAATSGLRAEIARLQGQLTGRTETARPAAQTPPAPTAPEWKRYAAHPDAPKLADFNSVEEHTAATAFFVAKTMLAEHGQQAQQRAEHDEITASQQQRVDSFVGKLHEARAADPEFVNKLSPRVRDNLKPFEALTPGEASGPINVIGAQVYDSPIAPAVLLHFSQHPQELAALEAIPPSIAMLPPAVRTRAHIQHIIREFGKLEGRLAGGASGITSTSPAQPSAAAIPSTVSAVSAPPPTIQKAGTTSDPEAAAFARNDFSGFRAVRAAERMSRIQRG